MDWLGSVCPVVKVSGTLKISCFTISGCIANKLANQDSPKLLKDIQTVGRLFM